MPKKHKFEDVDFHLDLGEPPQEVLDWAREHIGENEQNKSMKLYELREMIFDLKLYLPKTNESKTIVSSKRSPSIIPVNFARVICYLPSVNQAHNPQRGDIIAHRTDDAFLLRFLRARSFNLESAYKLIVNYYNFKEDNPILHENVDPMEVRIIGDHDVIQVLPYREQTGRRIMIYKLGNWNPSEYKVDELFKATLALLELGILEPRAQILGGICIFDLKDLTMNHAWQLSPSVARKVVELMVTSFPLKVYALHIVFETKVFDVVYNIFKPLLSERMKKKIFFHGNDLDSLHKHIRPKHLPKRYGGIKPNYKYNRWIEGFRTDPKIYEEMKSLGYVFKDEFLNQRFITSEDENTESDSE